MGCQCHSTMEDLLSMLEVSRCHPWHNKQIDSSEINHSLTCRGEPVSMAKVISYGHIGNKKEMMDALGINI